MYKLITYTDGACSGNPGPMGAGALLMTTDVNPKIRKISQSLGHGTNNIAELQAISLALSAVHFKARANTHITVYTDSQYCIGVLGKGWKARQNLVLVLSVRSLVAEFAKVTFEKVKAHTGDKYNEWANHLALQGVKGNTINVMV